MRRHPLHRLVVLAVLIATLVLVAARTQVGPRALERTRGHASVTAGLIPQGHTLITRGHGSHQPLDVSKSPAARSFALHLPTPQQSSVADCDRLRAIASGTDRPFGCRAPPQL